MHSKYIFQSDACLTTKLNLTRKLVNDLQKIEFKKKFYKKCIKKKTQKNVQPKT